MSSSVGTKTDHRRTCCARSQNPVCSVLEVVILVRHYGSDRSCCLPRLNLVSEAVLVQVVVSHYLLFCSLRVARILYRRLFFFKSCFFFSQSNLTLSNPGRGLNTTNVKRHSQTPCECPHWREDTASPATQTRLHHFHLIGVRRNRGGGGWGGCKGD